MDFKKFVQAGLTQGELASLIGVSRVTVNNWIHGRKAPDNITNRDTEAKLEKVMNKITEALDMGLLPIDPSVKREDRASEINKVFEQV